MVIFCGLWGNPFLQTAHHLNVIQAPFVISWVFMGLAVGSRVFSLIEYRIQNRLQVMILTTLLSVLGMSIVILFHPLLQWISSVFLFGFGFFPGTFP